MVLAADKKELFVLERCALGPGATPPGVDVRLPPGFDGTVHVEVFKAPDATVCDHASVSLVATALKSDGLTALLGAEHIVFDSAVTLKLYVQKRKAQWDSTNFYFRQAHTSAAPYRTDLLLRGVIWAMALLLVAGRTHFAPVCATDASEKRPSVLSLTLGPQTSSQAASLRTAIPPPPMVCVVCVSERKL